MGAITYWITIQVPLWIPFLCVFAGVLSGYLIGHQQRKEEVEEAVNAEFLRRRNALTDRGRTTDRRPEHDGLPPAVNRRVVVRGRTVGPADKPRNQL